MATRKRSPEAAAPTPEGAAALGAAPGAGDGPATASASVPERSPSPAPSLVPSPVPRVPVRHYAAARPEQIRCGGYVLTERGWVLDTTSTHDQES